jgi:hypothetical protein
LKVWARPLVTISLLAAACTTSAPASQGPSPSVSRATTPGTSASPSPLEQVNVAFVRDNSVPDADEHALPALQGAQLAFQTGALADPDAAFIRLALVDVGEDPSALEAVAADPSFVAVIVAPGVGVDVPEGVPVVSLSGLVPASDAGARLVPPTATTARTLARTVRNGPCILSEDPPPDPLGALVATRSGEHAHTIDVDEVSAAVSERGCGTVVWTGGPDGAADVAVALEGTDVRLVGGDRLLDFDFLAEAGASGEGAPTCRPRRRSRLGGSSRTTSRSSGPRRRRIRSRGGTRGTWSVGPLGTGRRPGRRWVPGSAASPPTGASPAPTGSEPTARSSTPAARSASIGSWAGDG